jgi:hypothetical protein
MKANPYQDLPEESFWSSGVARSTTLVPKHIYQKKWDIRPGDRIATAGSCFAQHIGRHMRTSGFSVMDMEPAPRLLPADQHGKYGYSIYSARYGNIYTIRQMLQLAKEAFGMWQPGELVWVGKNGACFDALRPGVEPDGLGSPDEVLAHRQRHLALVREMLGNLDVLIFTLGLTEAWIHRETGTVFPTAPGTIAGTHDPALHEFKNFGFDEILADLNELRGFLRSVRKHAGEPRILLTVSPVPLTATASGMHVLPATVYSKAVLRAVAGQLAMSAPDVDYFPSFEIISNPWSKVSFYEENQRSVKASGVAEVMRTFFEAHDCGVPHGIPVIAAPAAVKSTEIDAGEDVVCEEALLDAFGRRS